MRLLKYTLLSPIYSAARAVLNDVLVRLANMLSILGKEPRRCRSRRRYSLAMTLQVRMPRFQLARPRPGSVVYRVWQL